MGNPETLNNFNQQRFISCLYFRNATEQLAASVHPLSEHGEGKKAGTSHTGSYSHCPERQAPFSFKFHWHIPKHLLFLDRVGKVTLKDPIKTGDTECSWATLLTSTTRLEAPRLARYIPITNSGPGFQNSCLCTWSHVILPPALGGRHSHPFQAS
jgi:hypothetical protein